MTSSDMDYIDVAASDINLMSVEELVSWLEENGIPREFSEKFEGILYYRCKSKAKPRLTSQITITISYSVR